jgi:DNA-nicking Smr family endonuclease
VLKRRLPDWLTEPALRAVVSGFAPAHRKHGGAGAWYVFLKRRSDQ